MLLSRQSKSKFTNFYVSQTKPVNPYNCIRLSHALLLLVYLLHAEVSTNSYEDKFLICPVGVLQIITDFGKVMTRTKKSRTWVLF